MRLMVAMAVAVCATSAVADSGRKGGAAKQVSSIPLGNVGFLDVSWRIWMSPSGRVPQYDGDPDLDTRTPWEKMGKALRARAGGIVKHVYAAAGIDSYYGASRDGTSPRIVQAEIGFGKALRYWSQGGPTVTDYEEVDCVEYREIPHDVTRPYAGPTRTCAVEHYKKWRVIDYTPPGWVKLWYAGYAGWRQVGDFLGGDAEQTAPLVSGGGPIVGATAFMKRRALAVELSQELVYYVTGWDDHGHLGYNGRIGAGIPYGLAGFAWRLDPAAGKEFMIDVRLRVDVF